MSQKTEASVLQNVSCMQYSQKKNSMRHPYAVCEYVWMRYKTLLSDLAARQIGKIYFHCLVAVNILHQQPPVTRGTCKTETWTSQAPSRGWVTHLRQKLGRPSGKVLSVLAHYSQYDLERPRDLWTFKSFAHLNRAFPFTPITGFKSK